MPTLSVVIPCYNEVSTIEAIIDAVERSPVKDLEIIVVDDCSTDGTREVLREKIEPRIARVIFTRSSRKGAGCAWLEAGTGTW